MSDRSLPDHRRRVRRPKKPSKGTFSWFAIPLAVALQIVGQGIIVLVTGDFAIIAAGLSQLLYMLPAIGLALGLGRRDYAYTLAVVTGLTLLLNATLCMTGGL